MISVGDAAYETCRDLGLTTMFANPGSTEIPFLCRSDSGIRFVLALHEGSVVGAATGFALATGDPSLAVLHTAAGYGNAVGALATARVNRAPLVVIVGQQDRRHLPLRPFLAGDLDGLAGSYPVWRCQPALATDVPGSIEQAWHEAKTRRGPAVVVVPMDDWDAEAKPGSRVAARRIVDASAADPRAIEDLAALIETSASPAIVAGAAADSEEAWQATVSLAERLQAPVWQEAFGARAGFPQDHRLFAGHLPSSRGRLRCSLRQHDLIVVIGAPAFRQYPYESGQLVAEGVRVAMVVDDPEVAHHSPADLAIIGPIPAVISRLANLVTVRRPRQNQAESDALAMLEGSPAATGSTHVLRPSDVFRGLARRVDEDCVVVEECPSSRPDLHRILPARRPLGFVSAAMGGLGFAMPAAVGIRMGLPERQVVAVTGDGSALYGIQAVWTAVHYKVAVVFVVLSNGRYAIMDHLATRRGMPGPWPSFSEINIAQIARGFGCSTRRVEGHRELEDALDEAVSHWTRADEPLLIDAVVGDGSEFTP